MDASRVSFRRLITYTIVYTTVSFTLRYQLTEIRRNDFLFPAFKEVFDLFDSNGGGTIDADELDLALRSVDIQLSQEEIVDVLTSMDKDGKKKRERREMKRKLARKGK